MARLRLKEILKKTESFFKKVGIDTPRLDAEVLLAEVLDLERINLYVNFNRPLTKKEVDEYRELVVKRKKGQPVAYLVGKKEFMSLEFKITSDVLIPRPETEHLVGSVLDRIEKRPKEKIKIVDVGTGSGAVIVSIAKLADKPIVGLATDISKPALKVAKENAHCHQVSEQIEFREGDLLEPLKEKVDIIASNPPYIPSSEWDDLQKEVKEEPRQALDGGKEGLECYKRLIKQAAKKLGDGGFLALEIGVNQAKAIEDMLSKAGFSKIKKKKDYNDIIRVVTAVIGV